jgi:hypothetical protein
MVGVMIALIAVYVHHYTPPKPNLARSVLLSDAVASLGARCLDGSPQRFWVQNASSAVNRTKWYFHFMGGGDCDSLTSCAARAYDPSDCYRGSSNVSCFNGNSDNDGKSFAEEMDFLNIPCVNGARWGGGLILNDPVRNPLTHDWNKVEIQYCDGGMFVGNNRTVTHVSYGGRDNLPLYFRGKRNVDAVLDWLVKHQHMDESTHILVSGDSAGGQATFWSIDSFQARFKNALVVGAPDSGFFFNTDPSWPASLEWIVDQMNGTAGLDSSCVAAATAACKSPAKTCTLPEDVAPHITTALFVLNSRYDPTIVGYTPRSAREVNKLGDRMLSLLNQTILDRAQNAVFITACSQHCGQWGTGQRIAWHGNNWDDFNVTIDYLQATHAINQWFHDLDQQYDWRHERQHERQQGHATVNVSKRIWIQRAEYPCTMCCTGGQ